MAAAYRSTTYASYTGGSTIFTVTKPSSTAQNDELFFFVYATCNITTLTGWTLQNSYATIQGTLYCFSKLAGGSEPASYSWTRSDAYGFTHGIMICTTGGDAATPVGNKGNATGSTSPVTAPSVTPSTTQDLLICCLLSESQSAYGNISTPTGMTERGTLQQQDVPNGELMTMDVATQALSSSSATGTRTGAVDNITWAYIGYSIIARSVAVVATTQLFFGSQF